METVTVTREVDAPPDAVRDLLEDREAFMAAGGFAEVDVDGDEIRLANTVGLFLSLELELDVFDHEDAALAYRQRDGIFREMETTYTVAPAGDGDRSVVAATTCFEIDVDYAGPLLDASIVRRKRRLELSSQLDYLADAGRPSDIE